MLFLTKFKTHLYERWISRHEAPLFNSYLSDIIRLVLASDAWFLWLCLRFDHWNLRKL